MCVQPCAVIMFEFFPCWLQ